MQEEVFYNELLPYSINAEADEHLKKIKANLSRAVLLRELRPGALFWSNELIQYMRLYGRRFSKSDHVFLIKLFYELFTIPDLEPFLLERWATVLIALLRKKKLLSRTDLSLPWRPLYHTVKEIIYGKAKKESLKSIPRRLEELAGEVVSVARVYFPASSTRDMLNEWRPLLCPFDTAMMEGAFFLSSFLPTLLLPEERDQGYPLWFDELMGLWDSCRGTWNESWMGLFTRLAFDNVGSIDWEPHISKIFSRILKSFGIGKAPSTHPGNLISMLKSSRLTSHKEVLITYLLGGGSSTQEHLTALFNVLEPYCHPSKSGSANILIAPFLSALPQLFVLRLHKEKKSSPTWFDTIPDQARLTEADIDAFVKSIKPSIMLALFNKSASFSATFALKHLASLRPTEILPLLLERTYFSLETLTEPHQLHATLRSLACVSRFLVDRKRFPEGPSHVIPLLNLVLPGIDPNDHIKTISACTFISMVASLVPFVDCSVTPQHRDDLTEDEKDLCLATAQFEEFLVNFLDRCFSLIENSKQEQPSSRAETKTSSSPLSSLFNYENLIGSAIFSALQTIFSQSSPQLFQVCLKRLFAFTTSHVLEAEVAGKMCAAMCRAAAKAYPEMTLKTFLPYCTQIVERLTSDSESREAEHSEPELIWILQLLSELSHCQSKALLLYETELKTVLEASLHLKCNEASKRAQHMLHGTLHSLVSISHSEYRNVPFDFSASPQDHLYIHDWGRTLDKKDLDLHWHKPSEDELQMAKRLLDEFLLPEIKNLQSIVSNDSGETMTSRDDFYRILNISHYAIMGATTILPALKGDLVEEIVPSAVSAEKHVVAYERPEIDLDPEFNRESFAHLFHSVLQHVLTKREDDTKSMIQIATTMRMLLVDFGVTKTEYDMEWKSFDTVKKLLADKLSGRKFIRQLYIDRAKLQHERRVVEHKRCQFTKTHLLLTKDLFQLSTSSYTEVRLKCQQALAASFESFRHSSRFLLPDLLEKLKSADHISHEEFKGALYILLTTRCVYLCYGQWDTLAKIWPALVQADHSEKPSVLSLINQLIGNIGHRSNSPAIRHYVSNSCLDAAKALLAVSGETATESDIEEGEKRLKAKNEQTLQIYEGLVEKLVTLAESGNLRWKYVEFCNALLTLLVRYDVTLPTSAVRLSVQNLTHESLRLRKVAISTVGTILRQQKRANSALPLDPKQVTQVQWHSTALQPGDREDNQWHRYEKLPKTEESWKSCIFVDKPHLGYYTWPEPLLVYSGETERARVLEPGERVIYDAFTSQEFVDKLVEFFSLEDRKGRDKFDEKRFRMFKGLFRNHGEAALIPFKSHLQRLCADQQDSSQRCAAEITAGVVRGSKHWPFAKISELWEFLLPCLDSVLTQINVETFDDWGSCIASCSANRDPRRLHWLFEFLSRLRLDEGKGSFKDTAQLYLLQGAVEQQEWRVPALHHALLNQLKPYLNHSYKLVRDRIGSFLSTIFYFEIKLPNGGGSQLQPKLSEFIKFITPQLKLIPRKEGDDVTDGPVIDMKGTMSFVDEKEEEKVKEEADGAVRLFKTILNWIFGHTKGHQPLPPSLFRLLPYILHCKSYDDDKELEALSTTALSFIATSPLPEESIEPALEAIETVLQGSSWKAVCAALNFLSGMVLRNLFLLRQKCVNRIQTMVLQLFQSQRLEVRERSCDVLRQLLQCRFISLTSSLIEHFNKLASTELPKQKGNRKGNGSGGKALANRHAGVLGLSACVRAFPYSIPEAGPDMLMTLANHVNDPASIQETVRKTVANFKDSHRDDWEFHKRHFTEDQLATLSGLLVSPNYYI
ncbi:proteasome activator complex subunit 4-like [Oscarella lobularis]|uniref:proteasome activator complex subunit 4-like n=1 Tax=Oscarella lobularis TaxID=121494 RepID=UPI00331402D6